MAYTLGKASQNTASATASPTATTKGYYPGKASQNGGGEIPQPSARSLADKASAERYGASFGASTENASPLGEAAKTVGNIPSSAWQFAKGTLDIMNPYSTAKKLIQVGQGAAALTQEAGGVGPALGAFAKETPSTLKNVIPESWRGLALAGKGFVTGNQGEITQGLETAQRTITNDPVGQILPAIVLARGGAHLADKMATKNAMADYAKSPYSTKTIPEPITKYGDAFDTGMTKVSETITKPIGFVAKKVGDYAKGAVESGISQTTGLGKETVSRVTAFPEAFTKKSIAETDRASLGQKVQSELSKLSEEKIATGKEYGPIRTSGQQIRVADDFFTNTIKETTGLDIKNGQLIPSGTSKLRDAGDVRAVQRVYDFWKPSFKKGVLTADEFLNFREDLAKMAKFEKDIGVRKDVGALSGIMRAKFNEAYRPQIGGLKELDASMSSQLKEFKDLTKGLVDKEGNMTDAGMAKIANLSANKPNLAIQLEKIVPGITEQIKNLQAITDIERASGIKAFKTGTYVRGALTGGAFLGAGIPAGVLTMILTDPAIAVPLLRQYGLLKNSRAVNTVIHALKQGATDINQITAGVPKPLKADVGDAITYANTTMEGKGGMSIKDVSKTPKTTPTKVPAKATKSTLGKPKTESVPKTPAIKKMEIDPSMATEAHVARDYNEFRRSIGDMADGMTENQIKNAWNEVRRWKESPVLDKLAEYKLASSGDSAATEGIALQTALKADPKMASTIARNSIEILKKENPKTLYRYGDSDGLSWTTKPDKYFENGRKLQELKVTPEVLDRVIYAEGAEVKAGYHEFINTGEGEVILRAIPKTTLGK